MEPGRYSAHLQSLKSLVRLLGQPMSMARNRKISCELLSGRPRETISRRPFTRHSLSSKRSRKLLKTDNCSGSYSTHRMWHKPHPDFPSQAFFRHVFSRDWFYPLASFLAVLPLASVSVACPQSASPQTDDTPNVIEPSLAHRPAEKAALPESVALTVPKGTPVQVALDKEVRIRKAGQPLHGRVITPVYAFDKVVIPVGSEVTGRVKEIESVPGLERTTSALNADFTPARKIDVEFTGLSLPGGKRLPIAASVTPGSGQVIQFVSAADANKKKTVKDEAGSKAAQAKQQAKQQWDDALKQIEMPGKIHRLERYAVSLLPVHPQYIDSGTAYFAELEQPLEFGAEPLTREMASALGATPPEGSLVHARLLTPLSSAEAHKGDAVEAVVSQPLFNGDALVIPQGSFLKGDVVQVMPARRLNRNGQLRFVFHELQLPDGVGQKIDAVLSGVEAGKADHLKLDSEGGAQATSPKSRYLQTGIAMGMAAVSLGGDADAKVANPAGNTSNRVVGGAGGFKLVGMVLGATVKSRAFGYSMGAYGAGMSLYAHFISRGREVVFPKGTAMDIGVATRSAQTP